MTTRKHHQRSASLTSGRSQSDAPPVPPLRSTTVLRKPRRNVGDRVSVCSPTSVFFEFADENSKIIVPENETKEKENCDNDLSLKCEEIRKTKDLPKMVNRIFEESLESQEVNFYIGGENDSDHLYETLHTLDNEGQNGCYDSFSSDTESENSFENLDDRENNGDLPLPAAPNNAVLTRLAATASKHMRKFTKNLSMTRNDISRSLTRITTARRKSRNDVSEITAAENNSCDNSNNETPATTPTAESNPITKIDIEDTNEKNKTMSRKGFLSKIRRSIIISPEQANEITSSINNKGRSTFYLTPTINVDDYEDAGGKKTEDDSGISLSPIEKERNTRTKPVRPQNPPPPIPIVALNEVVDDAVVGKTEDIRGIASCSQIYTKMRMRVVRPDTPPPPVPILTPNQVNRPHNRDTYWRHVVHSTIYEEEEEGSGKMKTGGNTGIYLRRVYSLKNPRNSPVRPKIPPPPVPKVALNADLKKRLSEKRSTSWYAEVNLCKGSENKNYSKVKRSNTCWYGEIGLYQNSTSTPSTSSAENSGTNTNVNIRRPTSATPSVHSNQDKENTEKNSNMRDEHSYYNNSLNSNSSNTDWPITSMPGEDIQMRLQNEPLYQFYDAAVTDSVYRDGMSDVDSENYEDVERRLNSEAILPSRPSAMELIVPKRNSLAFSKTLWCEIPEVLHSSVLSTLSLHQKKLQEAKFEMVTSEASYLNSLNVLNDHFMKNLRGTLTEDEYESLFGKIEAVRQCSDRLLLDLEKCWQDNILLHGVCDIIKKHAEEAFNVYIPFCENHVLLEHTMKKIRDRSSFADTVRQLETSPVCQCLSLYSFLMLPMQRITRWPLLLDAVLKRLEETDPEYITCQYVLATINKIVGQCNEAARRKERESEMLNIESKMEFAKGVPAFEVATPNRWLIRSGSIVHMLPRSEEIKLTFGKKISKATLHLFLFNDLFIVAKPKSDNTFSVMHYCSRNFTELGTSEHLLTLPGKETTGKHLFFLTILENQNKKTVEFLFSCSSESDKQRWIEALSPPKSEDPDEVLYECWDCPQVTVIHNYTAVQPDELNLSKGDVINVSRKMADGWFQGERIRDGQTGWFPANYVVEIANPHVRARNLKQRYRLLTFSENYLKNN
ncbi:hypothetical protein WA026_017160 [Henosepilachna vigintioctopunctata]|uniref:Rho guanine nucleotide exchange factor 26 n=1 Tax=Henosepilachna vigintioctopunctata TaxID=420089 RepID=A0AAW1UK76_9CUCU